MRVATHLFSYATSGMAMAALLLTTPVCLAADGCDFGAFYELSNVTDLGDTMSVTLTLQVFNHRDSDVYDVTVTVLAPPELAADLGTLTSPFIGSGECTRLNADLILPPAEYERWQQGIPSMPRIDFNDAAGHREMNYFELAPVPLGEEEC